MNCSVSSASRATLPSSNPASNHSGEAGCLWLTTDPCRLSLSVVENKAEKPQDISILACPLKKQEGRNQFSLFSEVDYGKSLKHNLKNKRNKIPRPFQCYHTNGTLGFIKELKYNSWQLFTTWNI